MIALTKNLGSQRSLYGFFMTIDLMLFRYIIQPDLAGQITAHKAKKTSSGNYYDLY